MQAYAVVHGVDGHAWRAEQLVLVAAVIDQDVEGTLGYRRIAEHEGQPAVDCPHERDRLPGGPGGAECIDQVEGQVRIRRQAVFRPARDRTGRDFLGNHVDAEGHQIADDVRVVGRQVVLLYGRDPEPGTGVHVELVYLDVRRQTAGPLCGDVIELDVVAVETLVQRAEKAGMQVILGTWPCQRQCGDDTQAHGRVACRAPVEFVQQRVGLADAERCGDHHPVANAAQDCLDGFTDVVEYARHPIGYS